MKYSKWQSGTIAPTIKGVYQIRFSKGKHIQNCAYVKGRWHQLVLVSQPKNIYKYYEGPLQVDGTTFFWRGRID
jgi:hypothetical protein